MSKASNTVRRERRGHRLALEIYYLLRGRSEEDIRCVYDAARRRCGERQYNERQGVAAGALVSFLDAREAARRAAGGESPPAWAAGEPTGRRYRMFRDSQPNRDEWPSEKYIINSFGRSWAEALAAVGVRPEVDVAARRLTAQGPRYSRDELIASLELWIAHVDRTEGADAPLTVTSYKRFMTAQNRKLEGRRMPHPTTLKDAFGSWAGALQAAGALHRSLVAAREPSERHDWRFDTFPFAKEGEGDAASEGLDFERFRWLVGHLDADDARTLTGRRYERLRLDAIGSAARAQILIDLPILERIRELFGSWPKALAAVGITPRAKTLGRRAGYTRDELIDALLCAARETGSTRGRPLPVAEYRKWREQRLRKKPGSYVPSEQVLKERLGAGSWEAAWQEVLSHVA